MQWQPSVTVLAAKRHNFSKLLIFVVAFVITLKEELAFAVDARTLPRSYDFSQTTLESIHQTNTSAISYLFEFCSITLCSVGDKIKVASLARLD